MPVAVALNVEMPFAWQRRRYGLALQPAQPWPSNTISTLVSVGRPAGNVDAHGSRQAGFCVRRIGRYTFNNLLYIEVWREVQETNMSRQSRWREPIPAGDPLHARRRRAVVPALPAAGRWQIAQGIHGLIRSAAPASSCRDAARAGLVMDVCIKAARAGSPYVGTGAE